MLHCTIDAPPPTGAVRRLTIRIRRVPFLLALTVLAACGGGGAADGVVAPPASGGATARFASFEVTPGAVSLAVGSTLSLTASARDDLGQPISAAAAPAFSSGDPTVAAVSVAGVVTGMQPGTTAVTATLTIAGVSKTSTATITVTAPGGPVSAATVTTPGTSFNPGAVTIPTGGSVTWSFSGAVHNVTFTGATPTEGNIPDQAIGASVTRSFPVAGTFAYECTRHAGMRGSVVVQGAAPAVFTSLSLSPTTPSIAVGGTVQLAAVALDQDASAMTGTALPSFLSSAPATASVSVAGVVTGLAAGSATITASLTHGAVTHTATATVTVNAAPPIGGTPLTITTPNQTFAPASLTIDAGQAVTWQFSEARHNVTFLAGTPTGGNIPDQAPGNAVSRTFSTPGTFAYECTIHTGMNGTVIVRGATPPVFTTLIMSPATPSVSIGGTVQLVVDARDQNGTAISGLPAATFTSSANSVATVTASGLATGVAPGTATVTASLTAGGVTHTATAVVTVQAPPPSGGGAATVTTPNRAFAPSSVTIPAGGTVTWQFSEAVHNVTFGGATPTGGNVPDVQPGNAVSRTFPTAGTYAYQCTRHAGMNGSVVVQAASSGGTYSSLRLTATASSLALGQSTQLVATPLDQNGLPMAGAPAATFASSASTIATVDATGVVRAVAVGSAQMTATLNWAGVTRSAVVTIAVTAQSATVTVSTAGQLFAPNDITIAPGQSVAWQFTGSTNNVTFKNTPPPGGNIPDTAPGATIMRTFPTAGTYDYECTLHQGMKGRVRVQ
jgi:trimeric autotransporter adhesin